METNIHYWDKPTFTAHSSPPDRLTGTCLNRIAVEDSRNSRLTMWLDEPSARALQRALEELYPAPDYEAQALDKWAQEHEGEFVKPSATEVYVAEWVRKGQ